MAELEFNSAPECELCYNPEWREETITILTVQMRKLIRRGQVTASGCTNGKWWSQDANSLLLPAARCLFCQQQPPKSEAS